MRGMTFVSLGALLLALAVGGCASPSADGGSQKAAAKAKPAKVVKTVDGLIKQKVDMPGVLFLRPDHAIGSYDAFLISPVTINYKRRSRKLSDDLEAEFKDSLQEALQQAASASGIPIESQPGECVMQIGMSLIDVDLKRTTTRTVLGQMTLLMEFRDSQSRQPLLRFATLNQVRNEERGGTRAKVMRKSFDEMLARMDVGQAMMEAGLDDKIERAGCEGRLARSVKSSPGAVSAR